MRRSSIAGVVAVAFALSACGGGGQVTTAERLPAPDVVVRDWLDAVGSSDSQALDRLVVEESLAFVVGVESRLEPSEITTLVDAGLPDGLLSGFWGSFANSFEAIDGGRIDALVVGDSREFDVSGARYAAVTVGDGDRSVEILLRRSVEGRWEVDVLATVGPGIVLQLTDLAGDATEDDFRTRFEQWVFPALEAAAAADGGGPATSFLRDVRLAFDAAR